MLKKHLLFVLIFRCEREFVNLLIMSDDEKSEIKPFCIERAKQGRANCKKCKSSCQVS